MSEWTDELASYRKDAHSLVKEVGDLATRLDTIINQLSDSVDAASILILEATEESEKQ